MAQNDIMIVDDNPANLRLLEEMLRKQGHEVRSFPLGRLALAAAARNHPDLILLDINMPEMNGYEVCECLKGTPGISEIPVIFLSALNEVQDKVKAFRAGAVDYISKPFQFEEVHARVETHLQLHHLQQTLKLQNERLEQAVAARTHELAEANTRLTILDRSKSDFLSLISHEFRTPLHGILGIGEIALDELPSTPENRALQEAFAQSRRRILAILDDALLLARIDVNGEQWRSGPVSLSVVLNHAIAAASGFAKARGVALPTSLAEPGYFTNDLVLGDETLLARAFQALLETAVKFSAKGGKVQLTGDSGPDSRRLIMEAQGRTIPDSALPKFFEFFAIGDAITPGGDLGLDAPVAHRILSLFGASVNAANLDPPGIRISISLRSAIPHASD